MRLEQRGISRDEILNSVSVYEIVEEYPQDKYLPSCLVYSEYLQRKFHIVFGLDYSDESIVIITAYEPSTDTWNSDLKTRRQS
jgi:hypothetical protein